MIAVFFNQLPKRRTAAVEAFFLNLPFLARWDRVRLQNEVQLSFELLDCVGYEWFLFLSTKKNTQFINN